MKTNDPLFNINFIRAIETRPCIWNCSLPEYSKRTETERAWAGVAEEIKDTVSNCRERWRNLRGAFLRSLKQPHSDSSSIAKRKYYLNEHLQFLLPYTKTRTGTGIKTFTDNENFEELDTEFEEQTEFPELKTEFLNCADNEGIGESNSAHEFTDLNDDKPDNVDVSVLRDKTCGCSKRKHVPTPVASSVVADDAFVEWPQTKKQRNCLDEDPNLLFLRSLLPDMMKMTDKQNRRFRRKVISLMDDILEDADVNVLT